MSEKLTLVEMFEVFCEFCVEEINTLRHKNIEEDYFYNEKYKVFMTDRKTGKGGYIADIEKALKDHTKIKELFEKFGIEDVYNLEVRLMNYELITNKSRVLEIIKDKRVDVSNFIKWLNSTNGTYETYLQDRYQEGWNIHFNDGVSKEYDNSLCIETYCLTQEEFNLLKEVLL